MKNKRSTSLAAVAIFFAIMVLLDLVGTNLFAILPLHIKPTLVHIPVIIGSILFGPKVGMSLGALMGILSILHNTLVQTPTSYLFSPLVENGTIYSLLIALIPRILIGLTPYLFYRLHQGKVSLFLAGAVGSMTNTIFVLLGMFYLFPQSFNGNGQALLAAIIGNNALWEMVLAALATLTMVPRLKKLKKS